MDAYCDRHDKDRHKQGGVKLRRGNDNKVEKLSHTHTRAFIISISQFHFLWLVFLDSFCFIFYF